MEIIDTHTHIYLDAFENDFDEMVARAGDAGITRFFLPNIDYASLSAVNALHARDPKMFYPMAGLHPCSVKENYLSELDKIEQSFDSMQYVAIGETGLDLYWDKTFYPQQCESFKIQIEWAKSRNLPIVIHARESFNEIFEILDEHNDDSLTGIFHCFTGSEQEAQKIMSYAGFSLGIGGVVTFKNYDGKKALKNVPLSKIVVETDAPYLSPHPYRGKRNEPSYLKFVIEELADIYGLTPVEIARHTTQNALKIFKINE